jgi:4a-hydroxytetrahydrobiopterin dehydratase
MVARPGLLPATEIERRLAELPAWSREGAAIRRTYEFADFRAAVAFVDRVADLAESLDHHPDIDIRYDRVTLTLSTHSAGGLTGLDFQFAAAADGLAAA